MDAESKHGAENFSFTSSHISSVTQHVQLCDPMDCSTPGLPVHHQLLEFTPTHVHRVKELPTC